MIHYQYYLVWVPNHYCKNSSVHTALWKIIFEEKISFVKKNCECISFYAVNIFYNFKKKNRFYEFFELIFEAIHATGTVSLVKRGKLTVFCSDENCYGVGWEEGGILHGSWTHLLLFHSMGQKIKNKNSILGKLQIIYLIVQPFLYYSLNS